MERLVAKYAEKAATHGLVEPGEPLVAGLDDEIVWNRADPATDELATVFGRLNINSLISARPREPFRSMVEQLAARSVGAITPQDSETRTFLHDLPVSEDSSAAAIAHALERRKCVILPGGRIVTHGTVSPEQAFVSFSSVVFACFVKFHTDLLLAAREGDADPATLRLARDALEATATPSAPPELLRGPFREDGDIHAAIVEAGRLTVEHRLVDSFFGNISYRDGSTIHISQTTSSLDELEGCIDPCPLDGSSSAGITASSELGCHLAIIDRTGCRAILHGHPRYAVILSLDCHEADCERRGQCHTRCEVERHVDDVPIVPGEVGAGRFGLVNTVPRAMVGRRGVIVYGHGLFTTGDADFNEAFGSLEEIEQMCRDQFVERSGLR